MPPPRREQEAQIMDASSAKTPRKYRLGETPSRARATMGELNDADRDAVWLRFFEGRSFAEVGARLRLTENAARCAWSGRWTNSGPRSRAGASRRRRPALGLALANQAAARVPAGSRGERDEWRRWRARRRRRRGGGVGGIS